MKLRVNDEAQANYDYLDGWWRDNRDKNPERFRDEVDRALSLLPNSPEMGIMYREIFGVTVRRVLLKKTRHYLYYWLDREADLIEVVSIWGTPLEDEPQLEGKPPFSSSS